MKLKEKLFNHRYLLLALCCLLCVPLAMISEKASGFLAINQAYFCIGIAIIVSIYCIAFDKDRKITERDILFFIFALGFVFRVVYVCSTEYNLRQHDVTGEFGHLDYIQRLYYLKGIPDEDFSNDFSQYYHPPVWHALCALWIKIQRSIEIPMSVARENLQLLSLFCSSAIMLLSEKLFDLFGLKGKAKLIPFAVIAFHPTFIIFSASINNDVISLMFALLSLILAIKWYRNPTFKNILLIAVSIGFAMSTKLSGGLVSIAIAVLFAVKLFGKEFKNKKSLIAQFFAFGVVCVPLSLWYQIRNLIKFGIPITHVTELPKTVSQYIGFRSVFERFFDFSSLSDYGVHAVRMAKGVEYEYFEYNIFLGALKTSVFGEYFIGKSNSVGEFFAIVLFWSAALLAIFSVFASAFVIINAFKNRKNDTKISLTEILMPSICSLTLFLSYVKFCFDYAFFCTMDFRYIALTVVLGALYIGLFMKECQKNNKIFGKAVENFVFAMTVLMSISTVALYGTLG